MRILIETIPHKEQRYPTIGDWWFETKQATGTTLLIKVSDLGDWGMESLIAIHELWEALLCKARGIKEEDVSNFDIHFEKMRPKDWPEWKPEEEPGDQRDAPYQNEHCGATGVERLLCAAYGIKWDDYEKAIQAATD